MARKKLDAELEPIYDEDLALPWEHLTITIMEITRGAYYVKVIDRRTSFSASAGEARVEPVQLVLAAWQRLCSQGVVPS